MCHDCPNRAATFAEIPWEQRRIRLLGVPGEAKYDRLHRRILGEKDESTADARGDGTPGSRRSSG